MCLQDPAEACHARGWAHCFNAACCPKTTVRLESLDRNGRGMMAVRTLLPTFLLSADIHRGGERVSSPSTECDNLRDTDVGFSINSYGKSRPYITNAP